MSESPLMTIILFAGAAYLFKIWFDDYKSANAGDPNPKALPGATRVDPFLLWIGAAVAILIVAVETAGEIALGVSTEQTDISAIFLLAMIGAGVIEEVLFRGYIVIQNRGRNMLIISIIGFSLLFALLHYQYYTEINRLDSSIDLIINIDAKAGWSLLILFINSLWFYSLRFIKRNKERSLLPCFVAHIASNVAVFVVKLAQGHVTSLW